MNASVETFLGACCQSKVIYVGVTDYSAKLYIEPTTIGDKEGGVYEHQRIVDPEVRALMRTIRSKYDTDTPEHKWITLELASKCGSSFKNIEAYLQAIVFWCAPINNLVYVKYDCDNAREEEKNFHEFLLAKAKKEDDPTKHVSGEMFDTNLDIALGQSALQSFLGTDRDVEKATTIVNNKERKNYRKLSLQQYLNSGIITRDHIVGLWRMGIIEMKK